MLLISHDPQCENVELPVSAPKAGRIYDAIRLDYRDFDVLMKMPAPALGVWLSTWVLGFTVPGLRETVGELVGEKASDPCGDRVTSDAERKFVAAMFRLGRDARDGRGLPVVLHRGALTAQALRDTLLSLLEPIDRDARFINGMESNAKLNPKAARLAHFGAEAAYWRSVALLAEVVACAIEAGR
jgi:hypothetical protein